MNSYHRTLLFLCVLWPLATILVVQSVAFLPTQVQSISSPPHVFQVHKEVRIDKTFLSRLRDSIVKIIWKTPDDDQLNIANRNPSFSRSNPPSSLLARYGGDVVLRFKIQSAAEAAALNEAVTVLFLDVWEFTAEWVDIRLSKDIIPSLLGLLPASLHHAHTPLMHDLAQTIFKSYPSLTFKDPSLPSEEGYRTFSPDLRPQGEENIFFRDYQPLSVIVPWMRLLTSLFPTHVRMVNIGVSYEGRDIPALRLGVHPTNSEKPSAPRKTIIIAGGSHAREWISTSTINYMAYSFITGYGKSKSTTKLLEKFDWIFIPTLNPDGYVYTWESDRLWRKNRQHTALRFCTGVDLDRAYGFEWDDASSKNNPCSESFSGEGPFQAVESRRFANWVRNETENNNAEFVGFLDFHSYSQQILYPYSYSCTSAPPSLENLEELAIGLAKAIRITNGEAYGITSACEGSVLVPNDGNPLYSSKSKGASQGSWPRMESGGGSALDWFYHELRVRYAYQIKLRDTGSYGFLLPSSNIIPTGEEALNAVRYFGEFLLSNKGIEINGENGSDDDNRDNTDEREAQKQYSRPAEGQIPIKEISEADRTMHNPDQAAKHIEVEEKKEENEEQEGEEEINWELRKQRRK